MTETTNDKSLKRLEGIINERDRFYVAQIAGLKELIGQSLTAADRALQKAESTSEKRFDSVNEFRGAMGDMQKHFIRSDVVESRLGAMDEKLNELFRWREAQKGRGNALADVWGWVVAAATIVISFFAYWLHRSPN